MTNTTLNVPRELLERASNLAFQTQHYPLHEELRTILSAPSPAGVEGLDVVSNWVLFDSEADKPYIKKMLPEGFLAFFDCKEDARRAKANNPGTDYKRIDRVKAEDAQAIIDGLRGEVADLRSMLATVSKAGLRVRTERDQQAQRIGELEGLLREARKDKTRLDQIVMHGLSVSAILKSGEFCGPRGREWRVFKYGKEFSVYGETLREALDKSITTLSAGKGGE